MAFRTLTSPVQRVWPVKASSTVSVKEKQLVWAGEAGDRSMWWGGLKRGGQRKVADRIVNQLKKDLFK
jgi:hypothetical protein